MADDALTSIHIALATSVQEQKETNRRLAALEDKYVPKEEYHGAVSRIAALEDTFKWLIRTIVGALLLAGLAVLGLGKKIGLL